MIEKSLNKIWFIISAGIFFSSISFAQTFSVSGMVTDSTGNPLPNVNIIILETKTGTASNNKGEYFLGNIKQGRYTIEFSMVGFQSRKFPDIVISNKSIILNVILKEKPVESEQIIISASKHEQKISELPVSAEILDAAFIAKRNINDFEDALRYIPGVNMTDDQISIRGSSGYSRGAGSRVLLTIEGLPFYTGDTGETIWEVIPMTELERVEIIKGAASSLYGSSAIGGVINLITREIPQKQFVYFKTHIGAYDKPSYKEWDWSGDYRIFNGQTLTYSNAFNNFGFAASLTRIENPGYRQNNFSRRYIGFLKSDIKFSSSSSLMLLANLFTKKSGNFLYWKNSRNALVPPESDVGQVVSADRNMVGAVYKHLLSENVLLNLKGSYYRTSWDDGAEPLNKSITDLFRGEVQLNSSLSDFVFLVSGIEASTAKVNSTLFGKPSSFSIGAYSQADLKFNFPLILSFGVRYDYNKLDTLSGSSAVSPKLGLNYKFSEDLIFRSSIGTGFRAPTPAEAFTSTTASGITVKPNPKLKSEKNFTIEAGLNYKPLTFLKLDLALFNNEYKDFIDPAFDVNDIIFINIPKTRIHGFEFQTILKIDEIKSELSLSYTYLWSRNIKENKPLKFRPRHLFYANVDFEFDNVSAGLDFRYWSRVEETDEQLVNFVPDGDLRVDVYVLDLRAGYDISFTGIPVKFYINANNVLNYNYVELVGNLAPIRNYSLSVEIRL
jgi:outer membrane receptor for ferrienterochelin and colicins